MAYKIEDINWDSMPEGAVKFSLETDELNFTWYNEEGEMREMRSYRWFTDRCPDNRTKYIVSDYHPKCCAEGATNKVYGSIQQRIAFEKMLDSYATSIRQAGGDPVMFLEELETMSVADMMMKLANNGVRFYYEDSE